MFQITHYSSATNSKVQGQISLDSILTAIKSGDENLDSIIKARSIGKGNQGYDNIKKKSIPTYRFNFSFSGTAKNKNIISATGLIYLDADKISNLPDSEYIFASWKSLSNTGFGILVRVHGLTLKNFREVYDHLSQLIGITSDPDARKATQQTVQSYDPHLYYNSSALIYQCLDSKKVSSTIIKKEERCITGNETFSNIRFNNIGDYFTNEHTDIDYRFFKNKVMICAPFIPFRIDEGKRNSTLFFLLSQYALLNPSAGYNWFKAISETINKKMYPNLSSNEIHMIVDSVLKKREDGTLTMCLNKEKRILFNPRTLLSHKQKMEIVNKEGGKLKSDLTRDSIYLALENWDFAKDGKITQGKVATVSNRGESTIKKYWKEFKEYAKDLNQSYYKAMKSKQTI